jgi:hypothetical protein
MHAAQLKRLGRHKSFALLGDYLEFGNLIDDHSTPPWSDATNPAATASPGPAATATDGTTCLTRARRPPLHSTQTGVAARFVQNCAPNLSSLESYAVTISLSVTA